MGRSFFLFSHRATGSAFEHFRSMGKVQNEVNDLGLKERQTLSTLCNRSAFIGQQKRKHDKLSNSDSLTIHPSPSPPSPSPFPPHP